MQLGPTKRIPLFLAISTNLACAKTPSASDSAKPEDITITTFTPATPHWVKASSTNSAGSRMSAKSIVDFTSVMVVKACNPRIVEPLGLIG